MSTGKNNIAIGFLIMGFFMLYGFLLIYLRDFAPDKAAWIDSYSSGKHFESRLAHVHGNLFAVLNIVIGYLLLRYELELRFVKIISLLGLIGFLMPLGILAEVYFGFPPIFVLIGGVSMTSSVFLMSYSFFRLKTGRNDK